MDILGIRAGDQAIEAAWVGGVTTVPQRAHFALAIDEFAPSHADAVSFKRKDLNAALSRADCVIYLIFACCHGKG